MALDTVIIGAGPAGLTAYLYCLMYGLTSICVGDTIGGKLTLAPDIIDYPGIPSVNGKEFVQNMIGQIGKFSGAIKTTRVIGLTQNQNSEFEIKTQLQEMIVGKTVIVATGNGNKQKINSTQEIASWLNLETEKGFIKTDAMLTTNIKGVFACGDCLPYPTSLEQLTTAVGTGAQAAAHVFEFLKGNKPPILWGESKINRI